jgi:hypothetical protein
MSSCSATSGFLGNYGFKHACFYAPSIDQMNEIISQARVFANANRPADPCYQISGYEFISVVNGLSGIKVIVTYTCCRQAIR